MLAKPSFFQLGTLLKTLCIIGSNLSLLARARLKNFDHGSIREIPPLLRGYRCALGLRWRVHKVQVVGGRARPR